MTGEHPAAQAEKDAGVRLSLGHVLTIAGLLGAVLTGYGAYAVTQDRVDTLRADVAQLRSDFTAEQRAHGDVALQLARIDERLKTLSEKLDDLKTAGVMHAKGRQ